MSFGKTLNILNPYGSEELVQGLPVYWNGIKFTTTINPVVLSSYPNVVASSGVLIGGGVEPSFYDPTIVPTISFNTPLNSGTVTSDSIKVFYYVSGAPVYIAGITPTLIASGTVVSLSHVSGFNTGNTYFLMVSGVVSVAGAPMIAPWVQAYPGWSVQ